MNTGEEEEEFLYSNSVIYVERFYNTYEWVKIPYKLSQDGNEMTFSSREYQLKKMNIEWNKEDILGSWYDLDASIDIIYTFNENSLVIQHFGYGMTNGESYHAISLTDKYYKQGKSTCYYYIIDDKLLLSEGRVLKRYINDEYRLTQFKR